jgi:hypothetical protein
MAGQPWAESDLPEEIAAEAMVAAFDPERYPFRGDKGFEHHLVLVAKSILGNRGKDAQVEAKPENQAAVDESMKRSALSPDARIRAQEREARHDDRRERILAELAEGSTARKVFLLYEQGVMKVDQQVEVLKLPRGQVYEARRRVLEVIERIDQGREPDSAPDLAPSDDGPPSSDRGGSEAAS